MRLVVLVPFLIFSTFLLYPKTITVPDDYSTIQAAINAASPGDMVYIRAGKYLENITITKSLYLVGEDRTQVIIQSPDKGRDVIKVFLTRGDVEIQSIEVTGGYTGIYVDVGANSRVEIIDVIAYENVYGIVTFGNGALAITKSYLIDNSSICLQLGNSSAIVRSNEIVLGEIGIFLAYTVKTTVEDNLVGLCRWGIYIAGCSPQTGKSGFYGVVIGTGNRVYGLSLDFCPSYPGTPWPESFVDEDWRKAVEKTLLDSAQGNKAYESQDYLAAAAAWRQAVLSLANAPFPFLKAFFYYSLGKVYHNLAQYEEALQKYQVARDIAAERGMWAEVARADFNMGGVYYHLGRYDEALRKYEAAREFFAGKEAWAEVADVDMDMGTIYAALGLYGKAISKYEAAREVYVENKMWVKVATIDLNMGNVYTHLGLYEQAVQKYKAAREVFVEKGMWVDVATVDLGMGNVHAYLGEYEEALQRYRSARDIFAERGMWVDVAKVDLNIGSIYYNLGQYEEAIENYEEALQALDRLFSSPGMVYYYADILWTIHKYRGLAYEKLGRYEKAITAYQRALAVSESVRNDLKGVWEDRSQYVNELLINLFYRIGKGLLPFSIPSSN